MLIIERMRREADEEKERKQIAHYMKRHKERQVALENDIQVRGKIAHRQNQKEIESNAVHEYKQKIETEEERRQKDKHEL